MLSASSRILYDCAAATHFRDVILFEVHFSSARISMNKWNSSLSLIAKDRISVCVVAEYKRPDRVNVVSSGSASGMERLASDGSVVPGSRMSL